MNPLLRPTLGMRHGLCVVLGVLLSWQSARAAAVTTPYDDSFQTTTVGTTPADWTSTGGTWSVVNNGTSNVYQGSQSTNSAFYSLLQFSDLGSTSYKGFTLSTSFVITDPTAIASSEYIGFAALASSTGLGNYYLADVQGSGAIRLISLGATNSDYSQGTAGTALLSSGGLLVTTTYTLTLQGVYVGNSLTLTFTVTDGTHTASVTGTDQTPWTGQYFGYRLNDAASSDTLTVQFNNFNMVPEPATWMTLAMGGGLLLLYRRRINCGA